MEHELVFDPTFYVYVIVFFVSEALFIVRILCTFFYDILYLYS